MNIINLFFDTINFLTIIPIGSNIKKNDYNYFLYIFFPLVGLVIGVIYASFLKLLSAFFPLEVSILFALTLYIVLADFFHLDGFSDTIDALFASFIGKNPKDVLKDPHVGSMGVLFLILLLFIKFLVLKNIVDFYKAIVLSIVISRWSMSVAGFYGKSLEISFVGKKFIYNDFKILLGSLTFAFIIHYVFLKNFIIIILNFSFSYLLVLFLIKFFNHKFEGINGDIIGFCGEVVEVLVLIIFFTFEKIKL